MKKTEVKILKEEKWHVKEYLVLKKRKVYVSKNKALKVKIIWLHYNILVAKHKRKWKITY